MEMEVTKEVGEILNKAIGYAFSMRQEYVTPEHLLLQCHDNSGLSFSKGI